MHVLKQRETLYIRALCACHLYSMLYIYTVCFMLAGTLQNDETRVPQMFLPDAGRHVAFRADPPSLAGVTSEAEMNTFQCDFLVTHLTHVGSKQTL